jgi:hypothetical protein
LLVELFCKYPSLSFSELEEAAGYTAFVLFPSRSFLGVLVLRAWWRVQVLKLLAMRLRSLSERLGLRRGVGEAVYSLLQHALAQETPLFFLRHIDQLLLCAIYGVCKVLPGRLTGEWPLKRWPCVPILQCCSIRTFSWSAWSAKAHSHGLQLSLDNAYSGIIRQSRVECLVVFPRTPVGVLSPAVRAWCRCARWT